MPKISVVIPLYNKESYIKNTIESVLHQDFKDFEIIVVDDGSTDNSLRIVKQFAHTFITTISQQNQGVAKARNTGVQAASGELIAFLDADDLWLPHHLSEIATLSQKFENASFFATAYRLKINRHRYPVVYDFDEPYTLLKPYYRYDNGHTLFYISNFAIKKSVYIHEKGFKSGIDGEDTEFFIRIGQKYPLAYSNNITMIHLKEAENSLFSRYKLEKKIRLLNFFKDDEQKDQYLKAYLDKHRFAWIMESRINGKSQIGEKLKREILLKNLNYKQKILIKLPSFLLRLLKITQRKLQQTGLFLSAFSK